MSIDRNGVASRSFSISRRRRPLLRLLRRPPGLAGCGATQSPAAPAGAPLSFQPRVSGDRIDGISVTAGADGGALFRASGFAPGDVIVAVNGQRVTSVAQAQAALGQAGGSANIVVDRAGREIPMRVRLAL